MYKKTTLLILASILILSFVNFNPIGRVFTNVVDNELEMFVNVRNPTNTNYNNVNMRVFSEGIDFSMYSGGFDLRKNDRSTKRIYADISGIEPGEYWVRISLSGSIRDVKYVPLYVY